MMTREVMNTGDAALSGCGCSERSPGEATRRALLSRAVEKPRHREYQPYTSVIHGVNTRTAVMLSLRVNLGDVTDVGVLQRESTVNNTTHVILIINYS